VEQQTQQEGCLVPGRGGVGQVYWLWITLQSQAQEIHLISGILSDKAKAKALFQIATLHYHKQRINLNV